MRQERQGEIEEGKEKKMRRFGEMGTGMQQVLTDLCMFYQGVIVQVCFERRGRILEDTKERLEYAKNLFSLTSRKVWLQFLVKAIY